jgi:hypothetical protein
MVIGIDPNQVFKGLSRESTIFRDASGRWFHDNEPVEHPLLIQAFNRWISRAADGRFCLNNGVDWAYIRLDGPPLFVRSLRIKDDGSLIAVLSNDSEQPLDPGTLRQAEDGALYCDFSEGSMVAKFDRHVMTQLESLIGEDNQGVFIEFGDKRVRPPVVADPLAPIRQTL